MKVNLKRDKTINKIVSHQLGVRAAVYKQALTIGELANANMASHHRTGAAKIKVEKGTKGVDSFVKLEDEHAMAIELGHYNVRTGRWTKGIYVLTRAAHKF